MPRPGFVEQSSEDVWKATAKATRQCLLSGGIDSPVAAYLMLKRGCDVTLVHFLHEENNKKPQKIQELKEKLRLVTYTCFYVGYSCQTSLVIKVVEAPIVKPDDMGHFLESAAYPK